jgi:N4-gp56 family major capsid protein
MKPITIEETLASSDVVTALTDAPYLIYSEILEGSRRALVFLEVAEKIHDLEGVTGNRYQFLKATQLEATKSTEAQMLSGMSASDKSMSAVDISITDIIWSAVELSDFLLEDFPEHNVLQFHVQNMGTAVMEYLDSYVYSTISSASGVLTHSCASLDYDELIDAITVAKNADWSPNPANPPALILSPDASAGLLKDTDFITTERYTTAQVANMVVGEVGHYAGCRVLESTLLDGVGYAFIVFPNNTDAGIVCGLVYKRDMKTVSEYFAKYGYTYLNSSIRATPCVVQAEGIVKITITSSP